MKLNTSLAIILLLVCFSAQSQEFTSMYQDHQFNHFDRYIYQKDAHFHTSVKPIQLRQVESLVNADSIYRINVKSKLANILLNKSWISFTSNDNLSFSIDPLFDFQLGFDSDADDKSWINTRGVILNARLGDKIAFSTAFYENQAQFFDYRYNVVSSCRVIPGQGLPKAFKDKPHAYDYARSDAYLSFQPNEHFDITFGHGKNFIGDGYRSMFLSDCAFNYPFLRITTDYWRIKYVNIWAQFQDLTNHYFYGHPHDKKWGSFNYLSINVTDWLNVGLFESIIWANADSVGYRGFDINYANPIIFTRPVEFSVGSSDNALMGISGKITLGKNHILYGQAIIDECKVKEMGRDVKHAFNSSDTSGTWGWWGNKWAMQMGYKTYDLFGLQHLDIQLEYNIARPFIFSHTITVQNYGHYQQSLAHPLGSNFKELVAIGRYNYKRLFIEAKLTHAIHGRDTAGLNLGNDIYKSYDTHASEYHCKIAQGQKVTLTNFNAQASLLINPRVNMNAFVGYTYRAEKVNGKSTAQNLITFGLRTSLQNIYYDF